MKIIPPHTLSLKWKALLLTSAVLIIITSVYTSLSYFNLIRQFDQQREVIYAGHIREVQGLIEQSLHRMGQFAALTASFSGVREALATVDSELLQRAFGEHWIRLQLYQGLDIARFYNAQGHHLATWGASGYMAKADGAAPAPAWVHEALESERPIGILDCARQCMQYSAVPLLKAGQIAGVVEYGISLTDIVLEFRQIADDDVALLVGVDQGSAKNISPQRLLRHWNVSVLALTNEQQNLPLLQQVVQDYPRLNALKVGKITAFEDHEYEVTLIPLNEFTETGRGYFSVIDDITKPLAQIREATRQNIGFGLFGWGLAELVLLMLLWRPMTRLRRTAETLPLLGAGAFERVRQSISGYSGRRWRRDEIDVLDDTAIALSLRLESLEQEVQKHTRILAHRMDELEQERDFIRNLLDTAQVIILTQNEQGNIRIINQFGVALSGYVLSDVLEMRFDELFLPQDLNDNATALSERLETQPKHRTKLNCKDGSRRDIDWLHTLLGGHGGHETLMLSLGLDVTEQRQAEQRLSWLADHDALSRLFNRRRFQEELKRALAEAERFGRTGALLFFDLDQFKYINDTSGHQAGDMLLKVVADTLKQMVRETDITARLGGDEFGVLISDTDQVGAIETARKISTKLAELQLPVGERTHKVSASIGIALFPEHARDVQGLLAAADLAMYRVKDAGRGGWYLYSADDPSLGRMHTHLMWKGRVEEALSEDRLLLHYQPIIDIKTGMVTHCEALLRMLDHDGVTLIGPASFIEASERTGLIHAIDQRVLTLGIAQLEKFNKTGVKLNVSINLSGYALENKELPSLLNDLLQQYKVSAERLIFEITETTAVADIVAARGLMESIRDMGCHFALDDFGTGFSSLSYLRQLPVDYVKIDGSFVRNLVDDRDSRIMVKAITDVASGFGKKTIAEFVETSEILSLLDAYGVDYGQGNYIGYPVPADELLTSGLCQQSLDVAPRPSSDPGSIPQKIYTTH